MKTLQHRDSDHTVIVDSDHNVTVCLDAQVCELVYPFLTFKLFGPCTLLNVKCK